MNTSSKRTSALVLAGAALGAFGVASVSNPAEAISVPQSKCVFGAKSVTSDDGWQPLGLGVSINNGTVSRRVVAQLAADMGVDTLAEVRIGYSIDGGAVQEKVYGPGNLANHTEYWQTRSTLAVIPLASGTHTVTPYWRISGASGKTGYFEGGCFTVEGRTK